MELSLVGAELLGGAQPVALPGNVATAVAGVAERFIRHTSLTAIETGEIGSGLSTIVTDAVRIRVLGDDRDALVDDGLPRRGAPVADRADVALSALGGPDGNPEVVVARFHLDVRVPGDEPLRVRRRGDLVLVPDGAGWVVDGYTVQVTRDAGAESTTTTARAGSGGATPEVGE